jgi:amidase
VRAAAASFERLGAKVEELSLPLHRTAAGILMPIFQSAAFNVFHAGGATLGYEGLHVPDLVERLSAWRARADELPENVKALLFVSELARRRRGFRDYAKAVNQRRRVRAAYDELLSRADALLLPTTPMTAPPLPPKDAPREALISAAFAPTANTQVFDFTQHPALSIPCGESRGLPVGMMLVGRRFEEATLYRAAAAFEAAAGGARRAPAPRV